MDDKRNVLVAVAAMVGLIAASVLVKFVIWGVAVAILEHIQSPRSSTPQPQISAPVETSPTSGPSPTATPCPSTMTEEDCTALRRAAQEQQVCASINGGFTASQVNPDGASTWPLCRVTAAVAGASLALVGTFGPDGQAQPNRCGDWNWLQVNGWGGDYRTDLTPDGCSVPNLDAATAEADCSAGHYFAPGTLSGNVRFNWQNQVDMCLPS